eukprot:1809100-Prymnesium_polylepis.2
MEAWSCAARWHNRRQTLRRRSPRRHDSSELSCASPAACSAHCGRVKSGPPDLERTSGRPRCKRAPPIGWRSRSKTDRQTAVRPTGRPR